MGGRPFAGRATFFWGVTFVIVKDAVSKVSVFFFLSQRFLVRCPINIFTKSFDLF